MKNLIMISTIVTISLSVCSGQTTCEDTEVVSAIKQSIVKKRQDNLKKQRAAANEYKDFFGQDDKINIDTLKIDSKEKIDEALKSQAAYFAQLLGADQSLICSYKIEDTSLNKYVKHFSPRQDQEFYKYTDDASWRTSSFACYSSNNTCVILRH